jgi:hypothetical protein
MPRQISINKYFKNKTTGYCTVYKHTIGIGTGNILYNKSNHKDKVVDGIKSDLMFCGPSAMVLVKGMNGFMGRR